MYVEEEEAESSSAAAPPVLPAANNDDVVVTKQTTTNTNQNDDIGDDRERKNEHVVPGFGIPDLFNQRARRWDMNAPRRTWCHLKLFVLYGWDQFKKQRNPLRALLFNFLIRFSFIRGFWALFKALFWGGYIASIILRSALSWVLTGMAAIYLLQVLKYSIMNYIVWEERKDLQVKFKILVLMPPYRTILSIYRFYGYWRSLLLYIPIVKTPSQVLGVRTEVQVLYPLLLKQTDSDCVRLSPQEDGIDDQCTQTATANGNSKDYVLYDADDDYYDMTRRTNHFESVAATAATAVEATIVEGGEYPYDEVTLNDISIEEEEKPLSAGTIVYREDDPSEVVIYW